MKIGSLASGYGGLDMGVQAVLGGDVVWHCEYDTAPSKILAHHWPEVPNLGNITAIDWTEVEPVDVLIGGYPCQPFSHAGKRRGIDDERHIWPWIADAIRVLRPRLLIFENVAGHLRLGFDTVLADLAGMGAYDVRWGLVRASDTGAPHRRERLWIVAQTADADWAGPQGSQPAGRHELSAGGHRADVSRAAAQEACARWHRHNSAPVGDLFRVGVATEDGTLVCVGFASRPVARAYDDGDTCEVSRVASDGTRNATSMTYAALTRAAFALGYRRVITYTQADESGSSLRAAGWRVIASRPPRKGWNTPSRPRTDAAYPSSQRQLWEATP